MNNANIISAVCSASCSLSENGFCFQSFEATGSKSAPFHYEKPDLLCQWETICCVVSGAGQQCVFCVRCSAHPLYTLLSRGRQFGFGEHIFLEDKNDDSKTEKIHLIQLLLFFRTFLLLFFLTVAQESRPAKVAMTVRNLPVSRGCHENCLITVTFEKK